MEDTATIEADKPVDTPPLDTAAKPAETAPAAPPDAEAPPVGDKPADATADAPEPSADDAAKDDKPGLPDDWREIASGGNEDLKKLADRYGSLSGILKALKEAKDTIRSGKIKQPMPDAKDEKAMAEWRKSNGVPDDPTGYKLPENVTKRLTDDDKPMLSSYTDYMHKKGATPEEVARGTEWYIDTVEAIQTKQIEDDKAHASEAEDALRKDLAHGEYKPMLTIAKRFVDTIPGIGENILGSRAPDGRLYGSIPEFVLWAAEQGREKFGDIAFSTSDAERKHTARKEEIEKVMNTDIGEYRRQGLDKEYAQILEREAKRVSR